ncbi:hypothetical protein BO71DRAFT_413327 [Aspergillus ellipticus CBS 707.79]|uniref:F-box domain-containing protein n=1 Tax=Aspergillus ellipticus CBS 707.79 TaxID=1448320 RepID=A0A319CY17_9EURO|nr:hypothetical protein BO71DRAFT_413327 [Aspergillus ellipticus CBS 707.79]
MPSPRSTEKMLSLPIPPSLHHPDELLLLIGKYIDDGVATKRSLTLCSKRFHRVFTPLLYRHLELRELCCPENRQDFEKRIIPLIKNLCRRQDLAHCVHRLDIVALHDTDSPGPNQRSGCFTDLDMNIMDTVDEICEGAGKKGTTWATASMKSLITLNFVLEFCPSSITNPTNSVTEINIQGAPDNKGMAEWIIACHNLETFNLSYGEYSDPIRHTPLDDWAEFIQFDAGALHESLLQRKDTLKTLWVSFEPFYQLNRHEMQEEALALNHDFTILDDDNFGSFQDFHVLEELYIRHRNLIDMAKKPGDEPLGKILPRSLKRLCVREVDDLPNVMINLTGLIAARDIYTPQPEEIGLETDAGDFRPCYINYHFKPS